MSVDVVVVNAGDGVQVSTRVQGDGPPVVLVPSLGRGAVDFDDLGARLAMAGYRAIAIDPRGVGESKGPLEGITLFDLASDVAGLLDALGVEGPVVAIGHAFGNRVVRSLSASRPETVRGLCLIACGGQVEPEPEAAAAMPVLLDLDRPRDERIAAIGTAFFAPPNDPAQWEQGWWPEAARAQSAAMRATDPLAWRAGGSVPVLIVQGLQDRLAPPENGHILKREMGDRVTLVGLDGAGHALLPEQPEAIAAAVLDWLSAHPA